MKLNTVAERFISASGVRPYRKEIENTREHTHTNTHTHTFRNEILLLSQVSRSGARCGMPSMRKTERKTMSRKSQSVFSCRQSCHCAKRVNIHSFALVRQREREREGGGEREREREMAKKKKCRAPSETRYLYTCIIHLSCRLRAT